MSRSGSRIRSLLIATLAVVLAGALGLLGCGEQRGSSPAGEIVTIVGEPISDSLSLREVLQHPDAFERARRTAEILQRARPDELEDILQTFADAPLDQGDVEYVLFAEWWARFNPLGAFSYTDSALRMEHPRVVLAVVRTWGRVDPLEAIESGRLRAIESQMPALRGELVEALVSGWYQADETGLRAWIESLPVGSSEMVTALRTYARQRALKYGFRETLEWTRDSGFPPDQARLLLAGALSVIAHQDPELAVEWLPIAEADGVDTRTFVPRIANAWGHHQPEKALAWVLQFDEDLERNRAVINVARKWLKRDRAGMDAWLAKQGDDAWLDTMRSMSVKGTVRDSDYRVDWAALAEQCQSIRDEGQRRANLTWLMQRWLVANPMEAEGWLHQHPDALPPEMVERAHSIAPRDRAKIEEALGMKSAT